MIGVVVNYEVCARDRPEGTWDFPVAIQIPYSGFYVQGPNFCEFCKSELTLQILML